MTLLIVFSVSGLAQSEDAAALREKAFKLVAEQKVVEALPLLEKLVTLTPDDADAHRNLGFALLGKAQNTSDASTAKQLRARAHRAFVNARDAGDKSPLVAGLIESIPADGGSEATFTTHNKADEIMQKAEAAFTRGKMDEALELYQQALKIDPNLYHAALFSGDVYVHKQKYADAETWYQRAIAINPDPESEMGASIAVGIHAVTAKAVIIALVDHPAVPPTIVSKLIDTWQQGARIVIPTWQNRGGHPVLVDLGLREELLSLDQTGGLRALFQNHFDEVQRLPVDSPFVARDMDTWDDYVALHEEAFGYPPPKL